MYSPIISSCLNIEGGGVGVGTSRVDDTEGTANERMSTWSLATRKVSQDLHGCSCGDVHGPCVGRFGELLELQELMRNIMSVPDRRYVNPYYIPLR